MTPRRARQGDPLLRDLRNVRAINECLVKINSIENEADDLLSAPSAPSLTIARIRSR